MLLILVLAGDMGNGAERKRQEGEISARESDQLAASPKHLQIKSFIRIQNNLILKCLKRKDSKSGASQMEIQLFIKTLYIVK